MPSGEDSRKCVEEFEFAHAVDDTSIEHTIVRSRRWYQRHAPCTAPGATDCNHPTEAAPFMSVIGHRKGKWPISKDRCDGQHGIQRIETKAPKLVGAAIDFCAKPEHRDREEIF